MAPRLGNRLLRIGTCKAAGLVPGRQALNALQCINDELSHRFRKDSNGSKKLKLPWRQLVLQELMVLMRLQSLQVREI